MIPLSTPVAHSKFNLNIAGIAGLFGGETAISAMATVHMYEGRRWLGWFNSPGSYIVAKRLGRIANSRFWDGLFPGPNDSPAVLFGLDGKKGPQYIAALSGATIMHTGHLGYLTTERCKEIEVEEIKGRMTTPVEVTYLSMKPVNHDSPVKRLPFTRALPGFIPITVSVATCVICALVYDWFSFSMILIGIVSSGYASLVIGAGRLTIDYADKPAPGAPLGHGILMGREGIVVIKGEERDVNVITKGRFVLEPETDPKQGERSHHAIGVCSLVLLLQFILQLLLVPRGTLFGQIMFLVSLGVSWGYNCYLSSEEEEKVQTHILFEALGNPEMRRFRTGTKVAATVFLCLLLFHGVECSDPKEDGDLRLKILNKCIPNDTGVWRRWKEKVIEQLLNVDKDLSHSLLYLEEDNWEDPAISEPERTLLKYLLEDARAAVRGYFSIREGLSDFGEVFDGYDRRGQLDGFIYFTIEDTVQ